MDESASSSYIAIEDDGNVSTNSIQEILEFSQRQANESLRLINEYDRESNDDNDVIYETENEEEEEESNPAGEDDEELVNPRAKMPRLHSNLDLKQETKEEPKKIEEPVVEEETCPICFEPWTNSGSHRLVCLKCGHLFGENCIERWVKSNPKCPQCNVVARKHDIRRIYARAIKCQDTTELDQALKDIEKEKMLRKKAEINASETKLQYQQINDELNALTNKYKALLSQLNSGTNVKSSIFSLPVNNLTGSTNMNYTQDKLINITDNVSGGCRIVAFSDRHSALLVSQPSNSPIFPGFGIKKINFLDFKVSQYIPVHSKLIRDMALNNNDDGIVLSCGLDKMIKMTNISSNTLIHSFTCQHPIWSCTYNLDNPLYFYAGLGNGHVLTFDKRKIDKHVEVLNREAQNFSPVCSLQYVPKNNDSSFNRSGILVTQLDRLCFYENREDTEFSYHPLLLESNIMSCSFEPSSRNILITTRPSQKYPSVRHLTYEFNSSPDHATTSSGEDDVKLNLLQTFGGSKVQKMLARSKLFEYNGELYGCAPEELSKSVVLWDVNKNITCCNLPNQNDVLDICPIEFNQNNFLCALADKQLRVFKKS